MGKEYDPNAPKEFYEEVNAQRGFGSPQISPDTPFHPHQQPSLKKVQTRDQHFEVQSALSEDDQIAHFTDKAFRNVLRECEPGLSKEQQYYAWRNACQNAYGEQADGTVDHEEFEGRVEIPDQNPPYQLGMEPAGFMDGVPVFTHINGNNALDEIEDKTDQSQSRGHDSDEEEGSEEQLDDTHAVFDGSPPFNPFSPHHNIPTPTAPRTDRATREKMLESSFSKAIQALEKDKAERIVREGEVDEAHLSKLRRSSHRRSWAFDDGHLDSQDEEEQPESFTTVRGREGSPGPSAAYIKDGVGHGQSPLEINTDDSFTAAFEPPEKQRSDGETMSSIQAKMAEHQRQQYGRHHDQAEDEGESTSASRQIPGLDHLKPSSPLREPHASTPSQPSTPVSPKSRPFDRDIRKSIEPETPRHLLNRECTPAFEDRSCTPSPRSTHRDDDGDEAVDWVMHDYSSPLPPSSHVQNDAGNARSEPQPDSTDMLHPSPHHPEPSQLQPQQQAPQQQEMQQRRPETSSLPIKPTTTASFSTSASTSTFPSKPKPKPKPPPIPIPAAGKASKPRPKPRRKSAIQGSGSKIEKPKPKPRCVTTTTSTSTTKASMFKTTTPRNADAATGTGSGSKVKEAVQRIEASVREKEKEKEKEKGKRTETETPPATRRSRRLIERKERTP